MLLLLEIQTTCGRMAGIRKYAARVVFILCSAGVETRVQDGTRFATLLSWVVASGRDVTRNQQDELARECLGFQR
jgi:hypothetical protein